MMNDIHFRSTEIKQNQVIMLSMVQKAEYFDFIFFSESSLVYI